jgi:hypothetical protein
MIRQENNLLRSLDDIHFYPTSRRNYIVSPEAAAGGAIGLVATASSNVCVQERRIHRL